MVSISSRLYRVDDRLLLKDRLTSACYAVYGIDDTQPYTVDGEFLDPDDTRRLISHAQQYGTSKSIWQRLDASKVWQWLTIIIVVGAVLYGFLVS